MAYAVIFAPIRGVIKCSQGIIRKENFLNSEIFAVRVSDVKLKNSDVYKKRKFKNCLNIIFTHLVKKENSGWLERIRKY